MTEKKLTYLEQQLEAVIKKEQGVMTFIFQREKIKLDDPLEMEMLKASDPSIQKEIALTEAELSLVITPPSSYINFNQLKKKDEKSRWMFASQLLKKVENHALTRLHIMICPENILVDDSVTPYFLHYGVKESLPPYEKNEDQLFQELKATIAEVVDHKYGFIQYLQLHETLELSPITAAIMAANDTNELQEFIHENIARLEKQEKELITVTKKKWKGTRYVALGFLIALVPTVIFSLYTLVLAQPKQEAFINSQEHFLQNQYSDVITSLQDYKVESMPKVVQYELTRSYIIIDNGLEDDQREVILNSITLQTDPQYYYYWIYIGRGNAEEALDIARTLEDRSLIVYGLINQKAKVKGDTELKGEEKQQMLKQIDTELDEYEREIEAEEEEAQRLKEEQAKAEAEAKAQTEVEAEEIAEQVKKEEASPQKSSNKQEKESQQPSESNN